MLSKNTFMVTQTNYTKHLTGPNKGKNIPEELRLELSSSALHLVDGDVKVAGVLFQDIISWATVSDSVLEITVRTAKADGTPDVIMFGTPKALEIADKLLELTTTLAMARKKERANLFQCNECQQWREFDASSQTLLGRVDPGDGQWYCDGCWENYNRSRSDRGSLMAQAQGDETRSGTLVDQMKRIVASWSKTSASDAQPAKSLPARAGSLGFCGQPDLDCTPQPAAEEPTLRLELEAAETESSKLRDELEKTKRKLHAMEMKMNTIARLALVGNEPTGNPV